MRYPGSAVASGKEFLAQPAGGIAARMPRSARRRLAISAASPAGRSGPADSSRSSSDRICSDSIGCSIQNRRQGVVLHCRRRISIGGRKCRRKRLIGSRCFGGDRLNQKRREVFRFLESRMATRIVGLLEKLAKGDEPAEDRVVAVNSLEIVPERIARPPASGPRRSPPSGPAASIRRRATESAESWPHCRRPAESASSRRAPCRRSPPSGSGSPRCRDKARRRVPRAAPRDSRSDPESAATACVIP